ncbi:MAG TPA: START domain-containing protein [Bacteroidales bacterium]|nr:START domain-containing protein [Bacteroidales bacterium]
MRFFLRKNTLLLGLLFLISGSLFSQTWTFVKEKDGIKLYTRKEPNSSLKSFKGVVILHTQVEKVNALLGSVENTSWWDENVRDIKVITNEKDKLIRYYLVYHVPWPFTDRDLCVEAKITNDPATGVRTVFAQPLPNTIPEKPNLIRITHYWQKWTIQPINKNTVLLTLEGFVDPAGNVPSWLYNMVIVDSPLKVIRGIQNRVEQH